MLDDPSPEPGHLRQQVAVAAGLIESPNKWVPGRPNARAISSGSKSASRPFGTRDAIARTGWSVS
ncbi:hypothetical protein [Streptomyces caatingaensis]|uniref:Uncharacterized protein n=1 Tax=Streptomyces caatingaensis TaxID=1678637 RepID=A0A0K9XCQ0_9ACTN|nr:hypothetical protein AC230_19145 [Streptomyces caatingaensis]